MILCPFLDYLQVLQSAISQQQPSIDALSSLSHSMAAKCSPEDSLLLGEKLTQLTSALKALQRSALGRRRLLSEGLAQAQGFASSWEEAMKEIEEKQTELSQFEMVGVDIDTVKAQLDEYKVYWRLITQFCIFMLLCFTKLLHIHCLTLWISALKNFLHYFLS